MLRLWFNITYELRNNEHNDRFPRTPVVRYVPRIYLLNLNLSKQNSMQAYPKHSSATGFTRIEKELQRYLYVMPLVIHRFLHYRPRFKHNLKMFSILTSKIFCAFFEFHSWLMFDSFGVIHSMLYTSVNIWNS